MPYAIIAAENIEWMDRVTELWHGESAADAVKDGIPELVAVLHRANFDLWHEEDKARDKTGGDAGVAAAKRNIDRLNQVRNDTAEKIDVELLRQLGWAGLPKAEAALHSETPGMILDRLSILTLKIYHTREEMVRVDAPEGHAERNRERLALLTEQRLDLGGALDALWSEVLEGRRRFKLYRQMKMYNDPSLNPVLYSNK